jgi:hypothetical protein
MGVRARYVAGCAVGGHRGLDGRIVGHAESHLGQSSAKRRLVPQALSRIRAMAMTHAVMRPGDVVQKHRRPQPRRLLPLPVRRHETRRVNHHARYMRLAMQPAGMPEQRRQGDDERRGKGNGTPMLGAIMRLNSARLATPQERRAYEGSQG